MSRLRDVLSFWIVLGLVVTAQAGVATPLLSLASQVAKASLVIDGKALSVQNGPLEKLTLGGMKYWGRRAQIRFKVDFVIKGDASLEEVNIRAVFEDPDIESTTGGLAEIAVGRRCLLCLRQDGKDYELVEPRADTIELPQEIMAFPMNKTDMQARLQWELLNAIRNGPTKVALGAMQAAPGALIKDEEAIDLLTKLTVRKEPMLVTRAFAVLISLGEASALDKALEFRRSESCTDYMKQEIAMAVRNARSPELIPPLKKLVATDDQTLSEFARYALEEMGQLSRK